MFLVWWRLPWYLAPAMLKLGCHMVPYSLHKAPIGFDGDQDSAETKKDNPALSNEVLP